MKIVKVSLLFLAVVFFFAESSAFAQGKRITDRGTYVFRKVGIHRGNQVRTIFNNYGVIAQPGDQGPMGAWKYDADGYVGDVSPLVGVKLPVKDYNNDGVKDTVVEVIITPVSRPGGGNSNGINGNFGGFDPIPGFANATLNKLGEGVAMSNLPETWPTQWPDHPDWNYTGAPITIDGVNHNSQGRLEWLFWKSTV